VPIQESALRYLGIDHGHQAVTAHRQVVDRLRGLARRRGLSAWRLVGLTIRVGEGEARPSLEDFIAERELDGWTESEVAQLYEEAFPPTPVPSGAGGCATGSWPCSRSCRPWPPNGLRPRIGWRAGSTRSPRRA
jgi:hypothetical protein